MTFLWTVDVFLWVAFVFSAAFDWIEVNPDTKDMKAR